MTAAMEHDLGPLTWVKGEIDQALQRAEEALAQFETDEDRTRLKFCHTHVHQVQGALAIVGLEGVTCVCESLEALLAGMAEGTPAPDGVATATVHAALQALRGYLDELMAGEPDQALRLWPTYAALAARRGLPAASPDELFFPDLSQRPPRRPAPPPLSDAAMTQLLRSERQQFQKGLLTWLKTPGEPGRRQMGAALAAIEAAQPTPAARLFWWIALAFLETIDDSAGASDTQRQLCSKIDAQCRRLLGGAGAVPDRLLCELLYQVALAPAERHPLVAEVQHTFALPALLPAPARTEASSAQEASLRRLREAAQAIEEHWRRVCGGKPGSLAAFVKQTHVCSQLIAGLGQTDLKRLGQSLDAVAHWLAENPTRQSDTLAMEVATAILLLQDAQEHFRRLGTDFARQVDLMVARLHACMAGRPPASDEALPLLDDMTRRAQEKLLVGQVAREIQGCLGQIEQVLDAFFRDPTRVPDGETLDDWLGQAAGALAMLGHLDAVHALKACGAQIHRLTAPESPGLPADFEALAHALSLIGFFVDALPNGERNFTAFAARLRAGTPAANDATGPDQAPAALQAQEPASAPEVTADTAPAPTDATVGRGAPASAPERSAREIDAELLAIFLEEAHDVLATMARHQAALATNPNDTTALATLRRATHTLKGSGRMVGLLDLGETAWELEQTFNLWLSQDRPVSPALRAMVAAEHALFSAWVAHLDGQGPPPPSPLPLITEARRLRGCDEAPAPLPSAAAAASATVPPAPAATSPDAETPPTDEPQAAPGALPPVQTIELPVPAVDNPAPSEMLELPAAELPATETQASTEIDPPPVDPQLQATAAALEDLLLEEMPFPAASTASTPPSSPPAPASTLYDIFRHEAHDHLQTLIDNHDRLLADPLQPTPFAMLRAAHTLGGIAGTVGLLPLHHLGIALEHALLRRDAAAQPDSLAGLETVRQAIMTLEQMYDGLAGQQAPEAQPQLLAALEDIFPPPAAEALEHDLLAAALETGSAADTEAGPELSPETGPETGPELSPEAASEMEAKAGPAPLPDAASAPLPPHLPEAIAPFEPLPPLTDELDPQLLPIFLEEAADQLRQLDELLPAWQRTPGDLEAPHAIARILHTFKGNARMAGAMNLGEATHGLETRVGELLEAGDITPADIETIEAGVDALAEALATLRQPAQTEAPAALAAAAESTIGENSLPPGNNAAQGETQAVLRVRADVVDRLVNEAGELAIARARIEGEMRGLKTSLHDLTESVVRLRRQLRDIEIQAETRIQAGSAPAPEAGTAFDPLELDRFTRFQELTRFMAESVNDVATIQQNLLRALDEANAAIGAQARLNRNLQQELMNVRMLPFASQAERLYRIVRQTAREVGKRVQLDIVGGQVNLDRSVLERIMAPLEHMLRNAVVHGIEAQADREAAGKPETGELTLRLSQEGNEVTLTLTDDGAGLDLERIRARAEALGLLDPSHTVNAATLHDFIFRPGFSTADQLSQIAGRGVGMDVARTEITALGGRIELQSLPGHGTTFRIYLPLTLAVTPVLLVRIGNQCHAIPASMIEQALELKAGEIAALRQRGEVEWHGQTYPWHFLAHLLGEPDAVPETHRRQWVLLLRSGGQRIAVQVDGLRGNEDVVVKHTGEQLARIAGISGATVLGDGQIVLILNPVALAERPVAAGAMDAAPATLTPPAGSATRPPVLVVDDSLTVRKITSRLLTREGYPVRLAKDGVDALEQLADTQPAVILSDIEMPRMDGFDLVRHIRADARLKSVPIIMITSRTADKHRHHALEIGANAYLGKPYDEDELLRLIAGYVGH